MKVLFLEHQILYDPRMACCDVFSSILWNSGRRSLRISRSLWNPDMFGRPLDPISTVIRVGVSCLPRFSFQVMVPVLFPRDRCLIWSSFHHTMSGLRSVAAMWVGNEYPSDKSTVMGVEEGRWSWMMLAITCRT